MTAVHERRIRVRHYECDAYGHLNHANYLRYMQEAAFDASAAVGYDLPTYEALGLIWLVRATDITFLRPLVYDQTVVIKTWVEDFRCASSRRCYELRDELGRPVAKGHSDWVLLDATTLRPTAIPQEMITAFASDGVGRHNRDPFPDQPAPPPGIFRDCRRVRWGDLDAAGHVNNAVYLAYLEDCAMEMARAGGWPAARMLETGFGIVARRYRIEYLSPALMDDELEISTWLSDVKRATAVRHYTVTRPADEALLVRAEALWVWVDLATGRPIRIPAEFRAAFAANVV